MTEVSKEAVEALHAALSCTSSIDDFSVGAPAEVIKHLNAKGFTITRQPAMTDAELDWQRDLDLVKLNLEQLRGLSGFILTDGELDVLIQRVARVTEHFSEKYRG